MTIHNYIQPKIEGATEHAFIYHQTDKARTIYTVDEEFPYPDGELIVSRTDTNGIITHANDVFVDISGWTRDEIIGAPHHILRHPDMPREVFQELWETLQKGERWTGYIKNLRKDGRYYWVYATVIPNIRQGKVIGYSSIRRKPARQKVEEMSAAYAAQK